MALWREQWGEADNLLCVRLDTLGDVLMTTPAFKALKEARPTRRLTLLTSSIGARIAALVPEIDQVLVYDAPWLKATAPHTSSQPEQEMVQRLRAGAFDGAILFTVYSQNPLPTAFLCYLADIPLRLAHCRENPYQLLTHWVPDPEPSDLIRHEVRRQLDLVGHLGCSAVDERLSLVVPHGACASMWDLLQAEGIAPMQPWVVIHPGASAASRRYPPESFAEVGRRLVEEAGWQVVFTGAGDESALVEGIRARMGVPAASLVNRVTLTELAALLELAPLLIANNTGPVHMAAALGTPVVDLYALTNPQHTPWGVPHRVLFHEVPCRYCYKSSCPAGHHNCLRLVAPERVVAAARELAEACSRMGGQVAA